MNDGLIAERAVSYTPLDVYKRQVRMSKKLFNDLKKYDLIFTNEGLKQDAIKRYSVLNVTYWKFNIEKMQKLGY